MNLNNITQKKSIINILIGCLLFFSVFIIESCQKESIIPKGSIIPNAKSAAGNYITYSKDTICLGDTLKVTFDNGYNNNCGNMQIQESVDGGLNWVQVATGTPVNGILVYELVPSADGDYLYRGKWNATGGPSCSSTGANIGFTAGTATFAAVVLANCCETEFTGEAISCDATREANYTFTSEDSLAYIKIQGGLTNFTGADAIVTYSGGSFTVSQWTPGGSSNRIIRLEGSVDACETVTINIQWNSTNSGSIITGDWTVKDAASTEVAPGVPGLECGP